MIKRLICAALAAALLLGFSGCGKEEKAVNISSITLSENNLKRAKAEIDEALNEADFCGGVYVKLNKNIIYEDYRGYEDEGKKKEIDGKTRYQFSSLTKNMTGIAVLQLADEGKLSLDDTLDKFFEVTKKRSYLKNVTVNQLLSVEVSLGVYPSELIDGKENEKKAAKALKKKGALKKLITEHILDNGYGNEATDAHSNYYILGLIIEKVSGESYEDDLQKNIFDKLRMTETEVVSDKRPLSGYNVDKKEWRDENTSPLFNNMEFMFSSFGVTSTICDMEKFYDAILDNTLTKTNLLDEIESFNSGYGYGFKHDGKNLFTYGGTSLHTAYAYINTETRELALLCSYRTGKIRINDTGKAVYNAVNSKINGMLLDKNGN